MSIEASATRPPRVRRSPEAARENILAAAEALLVEQGPQAIKLADVARAAGVVHANVIHHFGSIGGVETALMERMIRRLADKIIVGFNAADATPGFGAQALFDAFEAKGAARLAAWLELTGEGRRIGYAGPTEGEDVQPGMIAGWFAGNLATSSMLTFRCWATSAGGVCVSQEERLTS